jgi:hypothetical protein
LRIIFTIAVALLLIAGVATIGWAVREAGFGALEGGRAAVAGLLIFMPLLMGGVVATADHYLGRGDPRLADDHRRYVEASLVATFISTAAIEAWLAMILVEGTAPDRTLFIRLLVAWMGLSVVMRGNFMAKAAPPTGRRAPDPDAFSRSMRQAGWSLVVIGAALLVCALTLPLRTLVFVMVATGALLALVVVRQRQAQQGGA